MEKVSAEEQWKALRKWVEQGAAEACLTCGRVFPSVEKLNEHYLNHAMGRGRFQVKTCGACGEKGHMRRSPKCPKRTEKR